MLLYAIAAFWGAAQMLVPTHEAVSLLTSLLFASVATHAAILDSRLFRVSFVHILRVIFFFTWPLAALVYLIATRGWRGLGWWLVHAIGVCATTCVAFCAAYYFLY